MSNETPAMTAWGKARFDAARPVYGPRAVAGGLGNDPVMTCDPLGMPRNLFLEVSIYPMELLQTPKRVVQFFEWAHAWREIWTDGRALPKDPQPSWMGYSIGKWDGSTLVVETIGFNDKTWLDGSGHPHSDAMHLTERFLRRTIGRMDIEITIDDPVAYTKPLKYTQPQQLLPDTELLEYVCNENLKDLTHVAR